MKKLLKEVVSGRDLSSQDAESAMARIMAGEATPAQIAGLLVALRIKGETVEEIAGFARAMRSAATRLDLERDDLVDTCGTGGDGANTFNVSTTAALIAAGAGVPVAKHGNRAVSSACGSADVFEALGVRLVSGEAALRRCLEAANIAFLFAPAQHPAMKHAIAPRRELGMRTVFNLLGPLTNPAGARRQVVGVYDEVLVEPLAEVLGQLGAVHVMVVHGAGGLDEISTLGPTKVAEWRDGTLRSHTISPSDHGIDLAEADAIGGGDGESNATIVRAVLAGEPGARRDIALLNGAAAIYVSGQVDSFDEALAAARRSIDGGAARQALALLVTASGAETGR
jgi:anthranilate phosphoribosyltransferase